MITNRGEIFVLRCWNDYFSDGICLYGLTLNPSLPRSKMIVSVAKPLVFEEVDDEKRRLMDSGHFNEPVMRLSRAEAQALMDRLFESGIRPTQAFGESGSIQAMKDNLADLRGVYAKLFDVIDNKVSNGMRGVP